MGEPLPYGISVCWQYRGYHANSAGPCFESLEAAVAYRDREDRENAERIDREVRRYPFLKREYDTDGWPDGRIVMKANGEPALIYRIDRDGLQVAGATRRGAQEMFDRMKSRRVAAASSEEQRDA